MVWTSPMMAQNETPALLCKERLGISKLTATRATVKSAQTSPLPLPIHDRSTTKPLTMQAMLSDNNAQDPPFYLQRSTSNQHHHHQHHHQQQDLTTNLGVGANANLNASANVNVNAPRRPATTRRAAPSEDRPFSCPVPNCGGRFHRKFTLHEHLKTHTGEQPHQCPVAECGKRFSTSGNLARHRKLHAMRKISCPAAHCTRVFTSREKLVPHLKVHLARTPHTCDFAGCGKTFSTAGNLTRHRRTQHRVGPSTRHEAAAVPGLVPTLPRPKFEYADRSMQPPTGSLPMRGLLWPTPPPVQNPPNQRILESDVQDLFDCLFVENAQAAAAAANGHHTASHHNSGHHFGPNFGHSFGHSIGHSVGVIRDRLPKLEPPRENKSSPHAVPQAQAPYLTATYEF